MPSRFIRCSCLILALGLLLVPEPVRGQDAAKCKELFLSGQYEQCIEAADFHSRNQSQWEGDHLQWKARSQAALGQHDAAVETLQKNLLLSPGNLPAQVLCIELLPYAGKENLAQSMRKQVRFSMANGNPFNTQSSSNLVAMAQILLLEGSDPKQVQNVLLQQARKINPTDIEPLLTTGRLALDKRDFSVAAESYESARKLAPKHPEVLFGLALALGESAPQESARLLQQVLQINPRHAGALIQQAENLINKELYQEALETLGKVTAFNPHHPEALALQSAVHHLQGDEQRAGELRQAALKTWAGNPQVDYLIGRILSQKYRFQEGAEAQRNALKLNPIYLPARKQLAQDLLRLGEEEEGWRLALLSHEQDQYDVASYNLATLKNELENFKTLEHEGLLVRMEKDEADIYGERVLQLLSDAKATLCQRYAVQLPKTVLVEIFPKPADFAVRTFGLPGAGGYLGVCFGNVITARSPASQNASPNNWESVLWHEFAHVITLNKTHNRMPRWLSEGISVYEERQRDARWGERMTPAYREMIIKGELTPISELSGAFLTPKSPQHLMFAYFESSLVVEYIVRNFGHEALLGILDDLGTGIPVNTAVERHTTSMSELETDFAAFVDRRARQFGWYVDWQTPDLSDLVQSEQAPARLKAWIRDNPRNYPGLKMCGEVFARMGLTEQAADAFAKAAQVFPLETGPTSALARLAELQRQLGDVEGERATLIALTEIDDDAAAALLRLLEIEIARSNWDSVQITAERLRAVKPLIPQPYTAFSLAATQRHAPQQVMEAVRTLLKMNPADPAGLHFQLAGSLLETGDTVGARRETLKALEQAPRYRPALELLLKLQQEGNERSATN